MNKKVVVFVFLFLSACICRGEDSTPAKDVQEQAPVEDIQGQAASVRADQNDNQTPDVGRADPFAGGFGDTASEVPQVIRPSGEQTQCNQPLYVKTVTLKFLKASNLKSAIDNMSFECDGKRYGSISVDDATNTLIICDIKENLEKILAEVKKADQTPRQIVIEVVIIDVQLKDDTEIGVDWDILSGENYDFAYRQGMIWPYRLTTRTDILDVGNATNYMTTGLGGEVSVVSGTVRNVVQLLQEKRNVDILASPRVMVVSGQKAEIKTIQEIPYQEVSQTSGGGGGVSAITSTVFKEVGVTLEVKATLTDDGKILLDVKPKQSVTTGTSIANVPVIDTREASTTLLMDDGQVVVMGGLRRQETRKIKYQVPLLGDLPLIGFIFSDDRNIVENSELLVLLSPHIYKGEPVPAEAMARFNQMKETSLITVPAKSESKKQKQGK
jgi:type II secretory pathway component GspD/PulD (secretin)